MVSGVFNLVHEVCGRLLGCDCVPSQCGEGEISIQHLVFSLVHVELTLWLVDDACAPDPNESASAHEAPAVHRGCSGEMFNQLDQ